MNSILNLLFLFFSFPNDSNCDCRELIAYANASEVFIGLVTKIEYEEDSSEKKISLKIKESYKGKMGDLKGQASVEVYSQIDVCGYGWDIAEYYMVFVEEGSNQKRLVNMCSLTTKIHFLMDSNGNWIGFPTKEDVEIWGLNNAERRKWEK